MMPVPKRLSGDVSLDEKRIIANLIKQGNSFRDISKMTGISKTSVGRWAKVSVTDYVVLLRNPSVP